MSTNHRGRNDEGRYRDEDGCVAAPIDIVRSTWGKRTDAIKDIEVYRTQEGRGDRRGVSRRGERAGLTKGHTVRIRTLGRERVYRDRSQ